MATEIVLLHQVPLRVVTCPHGGLAGELRVGLESMKRLVRICMERQARLRAGKEMLSVSDRDQAKRRQRRGEIMERGLRSGIYESIKSTVLSHAA